MFIPGAEWYEWILLILVLFGMLLHFMQLNVAIVDLNWLKALKINGIYQATAVRNVRQAAVRLFSQSMLLMIALRILIIRTTVEYNVDLPIPSSIYFIFAITIAVIVNSILDNIDREKVIVAAARREEKERLARASSDAHP